MSNISSLRSSKDRQLEQAGDWIASLERGITEEEERDLGAWLASSPENRKVLMDLAKLWDQMDALGRLAELFPESRSRRQISLPRGGWAIAATVVVALSIVFLRDTLKPGITDVDDGSTIAESTMYETSIGELATRTLSDGSVILLNTNSLVHVNYTNSNRVLTLIRGEIHVTVAKDRSRRLSVMIGDNVIQAVGTEFNIEITQDQGIELVVTEGVVMVGVIDAPPEELSRDAPLLLTQDSTPVGAGEKVTISGDKANTESLDREHIESSEIAVKLSWREGNLIFRGESLEEAVTEVGRYTAVEFVFLDEEAKKVRVAGLFKAGDVQGLLATLRNHFNIAYEWQGDDTIFLSAE